MITFIQLKKKDEAEEESEEEEEEEESEVESQVHIHKIQPKVVSHYTNSHALSHTVTLYNY